MVSGVRGFGSPIRQRLQVDNLSLNRIKVLGNNMSKDLFYTLAHTPLVLSDDMTNRKIIVCLSGHDFQVKNHKLTKSGLIARNNIISAQNIIEILDQHQNAIVIVSQMCKKYFDKETMLQELRPKIFALLPGKNGITNKLPPKGSDTIYGVYM